jgi:hypothetical protein
MPDLKVGVLRRNLITKSGIAFCKLPSVKPIAAK